MFRSYTDVSDVVAVVITCQADYSMMLVIDSNGEYYLPHIKAPTPSSWSQAISKEMVDVFGEIPVSRILRLTKIYLPGNTTNSYAINCVYHMPINNDLKNKSKLAAGKYKGKIKWVSEQEIVKLWSGKFLKTPEVYEYYYLSKGVAPPNYPLPDPIILRGNVLEICEDVIINNRSTIFENIVIAADFNKATQETLYKEFILLTFPATLMGIQTFSKMVGNFGWLREDGPHLFRAADVKKRYGVSFREVLYLVASLDPKANLVGPLAEPRDYYVFVYYDKDGDSVLNAQEFKIFVSDSRKARKLPVDPANLAKELAEVYKALSLAQGSNVIMNDFLKGAKDMKIKGIPQMMRSQVDSAKFVANKGASLGTNNQQTAVQEYSDQKLGSGNKMNREFDLAVHTIKINKDSMQINVEQVFSIQESASMNTLKRPPGTDATRRASIDVFSPKSYTNEVLKSIRYLCPLNKKLLTPNKNEKPSYNWGQLDAQTFIRNLLAVTNQVKEIFRKEPRLLRLNSPLYVMGDLHGNIFDLLHFEGTLWHLGANLCPCELLFLGDYVDRGAFSIEVIAYLFSYKLQNPDKVHLVRGNHEIRDVQKMFTFYGECVLKCGEKIGSELWNTINSAFDNMPIAAVVDGKIFCCHGGCPPPWLCPVISAINDIPVPLNQPNQQSSLAWEIMWNDPVKAKQVNDKLSMELMANEGFAVNSRRGTAHVFSAEALDRFLKANKLTHLIRAHEVVQAGYYIQQRGRMMTIFSSSRYCGGENEAACVLIDQSKLRILRLAREEK